MTTGLESLERWPGQHRGAGWVDRSGRWEAAGAVERPLRLASVTKVLTALGVLVATEEEVLALDEPAGPPGSTVRLLLCHASGLPFEGTTPIAEPGTRRIYGNAAFEHLGDLLAERTGMSWAEYVREAVCRPLGMDATELRGSPAAGAHSTVADLLRLGAELLDPQVILSPETVAEATTAQLPDLDGVLPGFGRQRPNPWGLGLEIKGSKSPHWTPASASPATFGHFGQSGSFLWVDPDAGVACAGLSDQPFGDWAREAWPVLGDAVLAEARRGRSAHNAPG
ncbi:MAG TPA: serine hydrolase domain-containing protein [Acidimicrobiales bacterium]|nr:serine hydrolase domain-containing protein [Acidimicrobiales bacterium]